MFFNELSLLEIRLNSLAPFVDEFILCESRETHSGNPKPLFFQENKDRFKDFKITHLVSNPGMTADAGKNTGDTWRRENYQREYLMNAIESLDPGTMIIISDLDEIPNLNLYDGTSEGAFRQKLYYYYLNVYSGYPFWKGSIAIRKENIATLNKTRDGRNKTRTIVKDGGWHFSYLGGLEKIFYKMESFAHYDLNTLQKKDKISENFKTLSNPYKGIWPRRSGDFQIKMPSGPEWLLNNKERYPQLWQISAF